MDSPTLATPEVVAEMVDVAGTPVAVRRRGSGDPLLFLHGPGSPVGGCASMRHWLGART